jgi:DNA-binding LytR/AlgR family response regulator
MNVLIIEDEKLASERLAKLIQEYDPLINVIGQIDSIKDAILFIENNKDINLIFMDIHLSDGISFDIIEKLETKIPVVFTTAYSEYSLKAFKANSIDYLLKPISISELKTAIDKFKSINQHYQSAKIGVPDILNKAHFKEEKKRFIVKSGSHLQSILLDNIYYFYSKDKITFLHSIDNKKYPIDYSLEEVEELISPTLFFRINRQYIININAIKDITSYSNSRLKLVLKYLEKEEVIVSREKVSLFKGWLNC